MSSHESQVTVNLLPVSPLTQRRPLTQSSPSKHNESSATEHRNRRDPLRRVQLVGRNAALATKQVVWDSNDASIDAAISAVDQWEGAYGALRALLVASFRSAQGVYGAAKEGAGRIENGLLIPVRDWLILPAFLGAEYAVNGTTQFLQSNEAKHLAGQALEVTKQVPVVGENVLAPAMCFSVGFIQRSWEIAQYPIPSKEQVRNTVDFALNGTKWALSTACRETLLYIQRADANITRTLSHTQWKVLGSGPYATLDRSTKDGVIDHICERYFNTKGAYARFELAAHIRTHNRALYCDLVLTGLLKERGGANTQADEWICPSPSYRTTESRFLLDGKRNSDVAALWFSLPNVNGKRPENDGKWEVFRRQEQRCLEEHYRKILAAGGALETDQSVDSLKDVDEQQHTEKYPALAQWYAPDSSTDLYIDEKRHAVSFIVCCAKCRAKLPRVVPPKAPRRIGDVCESCFESRLKKGPVLDVPSFSLPPLSMLMRPTFWRFHGQGDEVRRANWFLDTKRNGLQPFDEGAQAILEDAYLFLCFMNERECLSNGKGAEIRDALLTVEVSCPNESNVLVQFSSLTHATAIQQGLGAAVAIFKRRVYRGAWLGNDETKGEKTLRATATLEESISQAVEENGTLGETFVPDVSLRSLLKSLDPPVEVRTVREDPLEDELLLSVPPSRLRQEDLAKFLADFEEKEVDQLVFVVHGIGEMMRSIDVFGLSLANLSATLIDCCGHLRKNHTQVQNAHTAHREDSPGRVEYLPVEWHEAFTILSQRRRGRDDTVESMREKKSNVMLKDISLKTIPHMRDFANDTLLDVLYFMSPEHHDLIVDVVVNEMNLVLQKFRRLTGFRGRISLIGHSLGSIIAWDILSNQKPLPGLPDTAPQEETLGRVESTRSCESMKSQLSDMTAEDLESTSRSPAPLEHSAHPQLDFSVDNLFLLGSPVSVFLMIRNQRTPLSEDSSLAGCRRVFNIFHPFDPVAYRIEPCLDPRNADFEPSIMRHWNGGLRVQYQTKRLWRQFVDTTRKTQHDFVEALEVGVAGMGLLGSPTNSSAEDEASSDFSFQTDESSLKAVKTGCLNRGRRIDYMIQEKGIESANEYVAALAAHSCYWIERDLSLFIDLQIHESPDENSCTRDQQRK